MRKILSRPLRLSPDTTRWIGESPPPGADKAYLLMVLDHPEIPLHNNPGELDVRLRVRKRVVRYGPRSETGAKVWDAMETILATAKKLGVNFFHHIRDRVSAA